MSEVNTGREVLSIYPPDHHDQRREAMINSAAITNRLKALGLKQKDVAAATGLRQATVSQKINNIRPMLLSEAETIAGLLKIGDLEFSYFFFSKALQLSERKEVRRMKEKAEIFDLASKVLDVLAEGECTAKEAKCVLTVADNALLCRSMVLTKEARDNRRREKETTQEG